MAVPRVDNFLRAGKIWMKIWTVWGLTCVTVKESSVSVSKIKVLYSVWSTISFCVVAYARYVTHEFDFERPFDSTIQVYSACFSAICSGLMVLLAVLNVKREAMLLSNMFGIRDKYLLTCSRSVFYYFPSSCTLPCISLFVENIIFVFLSAKKLSIAALISYSFSVYGFLFQGQVHYYFSMVQDGFKNLNDKFKILERKAVRDRRDVSVDELRGFRVMYHDLSMHSKNIDKLYSSRVVLTVGHNFILGIVFTCNAIFDFGYPVDVPVAVHPSFLPCYWALCCFLNLCLLVQPWERVKNEARYTPIAVQSLNTRPGYKKTFYDELKLFSAQLVLEDFQPAPHNFLVLNNRMLLSTLGAVGSSLAIFLQMVMMKN